MIRFKSSIWMLSLAAVAYATIGVALLNAAVKKVFIITDMEGVDGIFSTELQCLPFESPRWKESQKLLMGEVNAAIEGLFAGGGTEIVVWDGHDSSRSLSARDIDRRVRLLTGQPISPTLELDSSYTAVIFVGQHAMAGARNGILSHSYDSRHIQNIWVNGKAVGEIGGRVMLAGTFGIPVIMVAGDRAACEEFRDLVPNGECAEVKEGVSRTAGFSLSHSAACALIRTTAQHAAEHLDAFKPYRTSGPVEVKVEFTTGSNELFRPREGVEQLDGRTWTFRGKDIVDAWLKFSSF